MAKFRDSPQNFDLHLHETKSDTENACSWNYLKFRVKNKSKCNEMAMFWVSLQNLDLYLDPYATDNVDLRF